MSISEALEREVDEYNALVTDAIGRAERLARTAPRRAREAWEEVALWEQKLASLLPADDEEGRIARRGAISALLKAGKREDADALFARYREDATLHADDLATMQAMLDADDARLARMVPHLARGTKVADLRAYAHRAHPGWLFQPRP